MVTLSLALLFAHTSYEREFVCPFDQTAFKQRMDASGTSMGMRLDTKKLGPIAQPWAVPVCPACSFVLGIEDQATPAQRERLEALVKSEVYRQYAAAYPSHFLLAMLREARGDSEFTIGYTYIEASWQVENDRAKYVEALEAAYEHLRYYLVHSPGTKNELTAALLAGEVLRLLGRFDEARERFAKIDREKLTEPLPRLLAQEERLIAAKNSDPQKLE